MAANPPPPVSRASDLRMCHPNMAAFGGSARADGEGARLGCRTARARRGAGRGARRDAAALRFGRAARGGALSRGRSGGAAGA
eukprot:668067-Prymnesium_polylepis.1